MSSGELEQARQRLDEGMRLSSQSKLDRERPHSRAIPVLSEARGLLRELSQQMSHDPEVWRLLSLAEECLLGHRAAVDALQKAIALCPTPEKRDLSRLGLLKQSAQQWLPLTLTFTQLRKLRDALEQAGVVDEATGATLTHTRKWLKANGATSAAAVLKALASRGARTDFEVLKYAASI